MSTVMEPEVRELLTEAELESFTGYKHSHKQAEWLTKNGIKFFQKPDGKLAVTWWHIYHADDRDTSKARRRPLFLKDK
mgnify:FL=1|tara:strand:+ start:417 stop:650 length:234 start_codon:yes stop_codon:yes gene_type:complete